MDFKQIEAFISVAKLKSFSKAANSIYLSQPTISSHISSLEKELNIQLFDRNSKEVNVTPAGRSFLNYAVDIINTRNNAITNLCAFNNKICGTLNVSASTTPCHTIIPSLINKFSTEYPQIAFNISEKNSGEIIEDIINLDCEVGLVGDVGKTDKIKSYCLVEDNLVLISSPSMNIPKEITIEDLFNYKFIMREKNSATRKTFEDSLLSNGLDQNKLNILCEINNMDTLIQFVKSGTGVSIVSQNVGLDYVSSGKLNMSKIKDLDLKRYIYLILNSKRTLTPTANAFFEFCIKEFNVNNFPS
ncbi:selenium metabolism-associated LysR family transcriptional regulator [Clostridium algidicarnis]|uniref:DNA-binding transcriptional LysR family regulator n=2 Tax=Clostridium algidicarnis TaxID=37659 RepID=A0A2S6FVS0_9CLOT|nr:selenium metabolism-associated LysR family transcriptional regulator [Clostridium algidicarnis]MBB6629971.1 LysR family transcriptional regulator [Clostridium algidicarnis]MBU3193366.1 LysR family transcriptional regulator [Clostridium algidicarnis]MBU3197251.1 LysR family transcriptional regulator [Clostridium algidicarnis]MBU3220412.1 LysR family transcriptional regulator [Clostridium algidicarnis]MCB2287965.1 LysR family transcriptional regulator [Clostridium algidicarnis]